jgi:hypothetical protein
MKLFGHQEWVSLCSNAPAQVNLYKFLLCIQYSSQQQVLRLVHPSKFVLYIRRQIDGKRAPTASTGKQSILSQSICPSLYCCYTI